MTHQTILVLDFGSQYTQLIARRLRELSVYSEILPFNTPIEEIRRRAPVGLILSGGPRSLSEEGAPRPPEEIWDMGLPILGICYGMQVITELRRKHPQVRVIAMSGGGHVPREQYLKIAKGLGAHAVLEKPFDNDELNRAIESVLPAKA